MATYSVYFPPADQIGSSLEGFRLIEDAKKPWALIAPPIWLIWHRLWWALLAYVLVLWAIILLALWQPGAPVLYLSALPGLYLLLEGSELIRSRYERKGWRYAGIVGGDNMEEAEIRFMAAQENPEPEPPVQKVHQPVPVTHKPATAAGLFPE